MAEVDHARHLVNGKVRLGMCLDRLGVHVRAPVHHAIDRDDLAKPAIGQAIGEGFSNQCMARHHTLDLGAVDVLAARNDHRLLAVDDGVNALSVDRGDVSRRQPAIDDGFRRRLRVGAVALHDPRTAHPQLARLADGGLGPVVAPQLHIYTGHRPAAGGRVFEVDISADRAGPRRALGLAIGVGDQRVGNALLDLAHDLEIERSGPVRHVADPAQ